jgi:ribonuclease J
MQITRLPSCARLPGRAASIVGRLSAGTNRLFDLKPDDTVVLSSHPIPGNEETISKTINRLLRRGVKVIDDSVAPIHVSGHAAQEEQKLLIKTVRPKHFMSIHGELRMLKRHAELAQEVGMEARNTVAVENGQVVELVGNQILLGERIPGEYIFVTGESIGDIDDEVMRERGQLARNGILLIDIGVDKHTGRLLRAPEIITRGFLSPEEALQLIPQVRQRVTAMFRDRSINDEKGLVNAVKSFLHEQTKRRPMVFVTLSKA